MSSIVPSAKLISSGTWHSRIFLCCSYVIICLAPGQSASSLSILIDIIETIYVCAALMLQYIMKWHFSSLSICQEWLWKKCVIAALTTRWHSALRQIPRGLSNPPEDTFTQCEKLRETSRARGTGKQRRRKTKRERDLCSSVLLCVCALGLNVMLQRCSLSKRSACDLA